MKDPFGTAPLFLQSLVHPLTLPPWNLKTLPFHIHEVLAAWAFYTLLSYAIAPWLSRTLTPRIYSSLNYKTRLNWDVHIVSFVQAVLICGLAGYVLVYDSELISASENWEPRIFGYSGIAGLVQALAAGYFLWDVWISSVYFTTHGPGSLAHAISALAITMLGFRPFANYYGLRLILYELSTPFLNIHWFLDKVGLTGSKWQWYNGIVLLITFAACRLVWGPYQTWLLYKDMWKAISDLGQDPKTAIKTGNGSDLVKGLYEDEQLPVVLAGLYLASTTLLVFLNFYWYRAMIRAVQKRFESATKKKQ